MKRITALTAGTLGAAVLGFGLFTGTAVADSGPVEDGTGPVATQAQTRDGTCDGAGDAVRTRAGQAIGQTTRSDGDGTCDGTAVQERTQARDGSGQGARNGPGAGNGQGGCRS